MSDPSESHDPSDPAGPSDPSGRREPSLTETVFHVPRPDFSRATAEATYPMQVEVVGGPMDGLDRRVEGERLEMGRGPENDLPLAMDASVSSHHARIVREGQSHWLEDLDSRNGTYLGEERILDRIPITPGATFRVGRTLVQFMPRR